MNEELSAIVEVQKYVRAIHIMAMLILARIIHECLFQRAEISLQAGAW